MKNLILLLSILSIPISVANADFSIPDEKICMAKNIYYEARGESKKGKLAVAHVTYNRTISSKFPDNICQVVFQKNQFSWTKNQNTATMNSKDWNDAFLIADHFMNEKDPTNGALFYHSVKVSPYWTKKKKRTTTIERHVFYK